MLKRLLITYSLLLIAYSCVAQQSSIDSLRLVLKTKQDDTSKVGALNMLSDKLWRADKYDSSLACAGSARALATILKYQQGVLKSWRNTGYAFYAQGNFFKSLEAFTNALSQAAKNDAAIAIDEAAIARVQYAQGNYNSAMDYYLKALTINQKLGDKDAIANNYGNMGNIYYGQLNYDMAIDYDKKAVDIYRQTNNLMGIRRNLANISLIYTDEKNYDLAIDFERQAMVVSAQMGNKKMIAMSFNNMGDVYRKEGLYDSAIAYYDSSMEINKTIGAKKNYAANLGNIGYVYQNKREYDKAIQFEYKSLEIRRKIGDRNGQAHAYNAIGEILTAQHKYDHADDYFDSCIAFSKAVGDKFMVKTAYFNLVRLDSIIGNYKLAFSDYKEFVSYNDSMTNAANTEKTVQAEMNYNFNQQQAEAKAEQDKKDLLAEQASKKQALILYAFMVGFLLMVALAFFIFRGYKQKQKANDIITKQKEEVEQQKAIVEEKNKEILDSITYAKRLQDAILPPMALIKQHLPESFVFYKPKDIVAGDFYWMEVVQAPSQPSPLGKEPESADYFTADPALYESLKVRAEQFRNQPTEAENIAWHLLKSNSTGFHIRRQHIIGQYIVDFVNIQTKTVIEIDGDIHDYQKEEDAQRTRWLEKMGYEVIRFKNEEVTKDSEKFQRTIIEKLRSRQVAPSPLPNP